MISELKRFGLTEAEAAIYKFLLQHGEASATEISKAVGIGRTNIYEYAAELGKKGLVSEHEKKNRNYFRAEPPEVLRGLVQQKIDTIRQLESGFESLLPKLTELYQQNSGMPSLKHYFGEKGFREVNNIMYLQGNEKELYFCIKNLDRYEPPEPRYRNSIQSRGLTINLYVNRGEAFQDFVKRDKRENRRILMSGVDYGTDLVVSEDKIFFGNFERSNFKVSVLQSYPLANILKELLRVSIN